MINSLPRPHTEPLTKKRVASEAIVAKLVTDRNRRGGRRRFSQKSRLAFRISHSPKLIQLCGPIRRTYSGRFLGLFAKCPILFLPWTFFRVLSVLRGMRGNSLRTAIR